MIRRIGNKAKIAHLIYPLFPKHKSYIELFFGGGGMFFKKPRAKFNFLNDIDNDVFNAYKAIREKPDELVSAVELLPYSDQLFNYIKENQPKNDIERAAWFLALSNWSFLGGNEILRLVGNNSKKHTLISIKETFKILSVCDNRFLRVDFRDVIKKVNLTNVEPLMVYADPPYLSTTNNYSDDWTETDLKDLIGMCRVSDHPFAISELKNEKVIELARQAGLQITEICERKTLKSRNTEILITNYPIQRGLFD